MLDRPNLKENYVYRYDGSFQGLLCCAAECFRDKSLPQAIQCLDDPQATLFPVKAVETDLMLARRVERSIPEKISPLAYEMLRNAFLTCAEEKELKMIRFLLLGYKYGARVTELSTNEDVHQLNRALLYLKNEAHYHVEFLRFSDMGGFLVAEITPNNNVLPIIVPHFCDRFSGENLVIYDKNRGLGFLYQPAGKREFFQADSIELPPPDEEEEAYRALWRKFYQTIAVEGRINHKLRRNHMPMRYWPNMTEHQPANAVQKVRDAF